MKLTSVKSVANLLRDSKTKIEELRIAFDALDTDKNGTLELSELQNMLLKVDTLIKPAMVEQFFKKINRSGNSHVNFEEFCALIEKYLPDMEEQLDWRKNLKPKPSCETNFEIPHLEGDGVFFFFNPS